MIQKNPGELTTAKEVSETLKSPFDATAKVMQGMASRGLLKSEQGAFGGYQIAKDLAHVTMRDLIEIIEGAPLIAKCLHKDKFDSCEIQSTCNIVSPVQLLNQKLNSFYQSISLKDLLKESSKETPRVGLFKESAQSSALKEEKQTIAVNEKREGPASEASFNG